MSENQVQKALCVLIQHGLVAFQKSNKSFMEYSINIDKIMNHLRYSRYIHCAKVLYGDGAELLVEEILHAGQTDMATVVKKVTDRLNDALETAGHPKISSSLVRDKFNSLVQTHFLQRCFSPVLDDKKRVIRLEQPENVEELFSVQPMEVDGGNQGQKRKLTLDSDLPNKRFKTESTSKEASPGDSIFWQVNCERFHHHFRDQALISAVARRLDKKAGEIMRAILRISEVKTDPLAKQTVPVSFTEIFGSLQKELGFTRNLLEQYLHNMTDEVPEFVSKCDDSGGGMYVVNIFQALQALCKAHIESVVLERFGSKSLRIFRVILLKKQVEQSQIETCAMIPSKEAKELLYKMFEEGFVTITELAKTPDHAPSRTFYLFTVDIRQVARMLKEKCFKAIRNAIVKRNLEIMEHKRLLDKQERVDAIIADLEQQLQSGLEVDPAQKEEVQEVITPPERQQLTKVHTVTNTLEMSELQVDETLFILESYLAFTYHRPAPKKQQSAILI
ncbi:hypothetical protein C0Q70_20600 [Pomacea canaliculata]|uniref:DNA-directed RNA polymerase III subunit RPC3 n=1 Tax=Pomacea canaliculata TaxID=400727 RepID=A0A2T7NG20_POMCA|nr:hypothetical protein C0Q70_20600 [Pomacea canaliculata]